MVDPQAIDYIDKLVEEYLLFRGFTQTSKNFNLEKKNDKSRGFRVRLSEHEPKIFSFAKFFSISSNVKTFPHISFWLSSSTLFLGSKNHSTALCIYSELQCSSSHGSVGIFVFELFCASRRRTKYNSLQIRTQFETLLYYLLSTIVQSR
jgi:hypothetical protein